MKRNGKPLRFVFLTEHKARPYANRSLTAEVHAKPLQILLSLNSLPEISG
jgi:hypothetical protein